VSAARAQQRGKYGKEQDRTDLGETRAAWQAWCTEVTKPER